MEGSVPDPPLQNNTNSSDEDDEQTNLLLSLSKNLPKKRESAVVNENSDELLPNTLKITVTQFYTDNQDTTRQKAKQIFKEIAKNVKMMITQHNRTLVKEVLLRWEQDLKSPLLVLRLMEECNRKKKKSPGLYLFQLDLFHLLMESPFHLDPYSPFIHENRKATTMVLEGKTIHILLDQHNCQPFIQNNQIYLLTL
jgi:hypothetical protein